MLTIRLDSPVALADQIVAGLRRAIAAGELAPGDPLPTVRQLAADLDVNLNTVARAYRALEDAGLASIIRGRGTRVTSSQERLRGSKSEVRETLLDRLRNLLADARLAGLTQGETNGLIQEQLRLFWEDER
ncbi:MAG: GntR family transcriptional regulator [Planctomycetota bacterium]|jgi:GntR family transcriptional regulator